MHEDFVDESEVEFEVDGKKFKYKPVTAGEENDWMEEYIHYEDGIIKQDLKKLNEVKIRNLKSVPYSKEDIKNIIGVEKEWSGLNNDQKWSLFKKLKPKTFTFIINSINKIDSGDEVKKKSSSSSNSRGERDSS